MSALRLARAFTGRDTVLKFDGCYHGHADGLLVKAGSGPLSLGAPDSPGVPADVVRHTLSVRYNDLASVEAAFGAQPAAIAAVIVEPIAGNMGLVPPAPGFLDGLRALTTRYGALLVFDEVITGFRVAFGGAQALYGVRADLTCLGKVLGGGLPVGRVTPRPIPAWARHQVHAHPGPNLLLFCLVTRTLLVNKDRRERAIAGTATERAG